MAFAVSTRSFYAHNGEPFFFSCVFSALRVPDSDI